MICQEMIDRQNWKPATATRNSTIENDVYGALNLQASGWAEERDVSVIDLSEWFEDVME